MSWYLMLKSDSKVKSYMHAHKYMLILILDMYLLSIIRTDIRLHSTFNDTTVFIVLLQSLVLCIYVSVCMLCC